MTAATLINGRLVTELRLVEGHSSRTLARLLGVSPTTIRGIEGGTNHQSLTLGFVAHLAEVLGTSIAALTTNSNTAELAAGDDAPILLAAVVHRQASIQAAELATALEWPLSRVKAAIHDLRTRLVGSGLVLTDVGWDRVRLRPDDSILPEDAKRRVLSQVTRRELNITAMTVLYDVMRGEVGEVWLRHASERSRRLLGSLVAQGLVEVTDDVAQLSTYAATSLRRPATIPDAAPVQ